MTDDQIAFSIAALKQLRHRRFRRRARRMGIGAMTKARWKSFFKKSVAGASTRPTCRSSQAYTLQFVDKGVGPRPQEEAHRPVTVLAARISGPPGRPRRRRSSP